MFEADPFRAVSNGVPDYVLRDTLPPHRAMLADCSEYLSSRQLRSGNPLIHQVLDPEWHRYSPDTSTLANQINDGPVMLSCLDVANSQTYKLTATEATPEQNGDHRAVPLTMQRFTICSIQQPPSLFEFQPIAQSSAELLYSRDSPNPGSQVRA